MISSFLRLLWDKQSGISRVFLKCPRLSALYLIALQKITSMWVERAIRQPHGMSVTVEFNVLHAEQFCQHFFFCQVSCQENKIKCTVNYLLMVLLQCPFKDMGSNIPSSSVRSIDMYKIDSNTPWKGKCHTTASAWWVGLRNKEGNLNWREMLTEVTGLQLFPVR